MGLARTITCPLRFLTLEDLEIALRHGPDSTSVDSNSAYEILHIDYLEHV